MRHKQVASGGEGSIYESRPGQFRAQITIDGQRRSFSGSSRTKVRNSLRLALREGVSPRATQTVGAFLTDEWLPATATKVRPSTLQFYEYAVRCHLAPSALGRSRLDRVKPQDVDDFCSVKLDSHLSAQSVAHYRSILRNALNRAMRLGKISSNPVTLSEPVRVRRVEVVPFTVTEAQAILAAAKGERLEALFVVSLSLGLRQGELLGLRWQDVDLDAGTLQIRHGLRRQKRPGRTSTLTLIEPKSERSRRTLRLPAPVVDALRSHRERQASQDRPLAGGRWQGGEHVFASTLGGPLSASNFTRNDWRRVLDRAGVARSKFHKTRHSAASFMLAQGVPMRVVMEILGHSQIALTANLYGHIEASMTQAAADKVANLLWPEAAA